MASTSAFSSSGEDAITRTIAITADHSVDASTAINSIAEFNDFYEIESTAQEIRERKWLRVRLA
jgi:hypothetical protein